MKLDSGEVSVRKLLAVVATMMVGSLLVGTGSAWADTVQRSGMRSLFSGRNIYAPNVMYDDQDEIYKMWYGGWQEGDDSDIHLEDKIYYRTSDDRTNWSDPVTVLELEELGNPNITHVNDPSVTKHRNYANNTWQYTMFYTVCTSKPCSEMEADVYSSVSADGKNWLFHERLEVNGSEEDGDFGTLDPAEPHAKLAYGVNGAFWDVYYVDRQDAQTVKMISVSGNRKVVDNAKPQSVYKEPGDYNISGPEVHWINSQWQMFFNIHRKFPSPSGELGRIDISKVTSSGGRTNFDGNLEDIIVNSGPDYCGTLTPGVFPLGGDRYDLFFGLTPRKKKADGSPQDGCFPAYQYSIEAWTLRD